MAGSKFQYDESGGTFFYFLLSFLALLLIPFTYYFWRGEKKEEQSKNQKHCYCEKCETKRRLLTKHEPWKKAKQRAIKCLLILGWLAFFATAYKVTNLERDHIDWDPFDILQIDREASQAEIKKAYRKLSLIYHPDKDTGDEKKFMQLTKAYAALTDEEAKKNWELYGNPDGPGAMSFGIALPSWIVEKENSVFVLGIYALVFMVALPVIVGAWWYRSIKYGAEQVLLDTIHLYYYFFHKSPQMNLKRVLMVLSASCEFEKSHNSEIVERPSDNIEVPKLFRELPNIGEKNKERPLCFPYSVKARSLLHAHLSRLPLPLNTLDIDRMYIVKKCPNLIQEMIQTLAQLTAFAHAGRVSRRPAVETIEHTMKICPMIVQAMWETKSPLLQLPHFNDDLVRHLAARKNLRNITQLVKLPAEDRRKLLKDLTDQEYEDVLKVAASFPDVKMDVKVEVLDDEDSVEITAGDIVTVTVILQRNNLGMYMTEESGEKQEDDAQEENDDMEAGDSQQLAKKPQSIWQKKKGKNTKQKNKKKPAPKQGNNSYKKQQIQQLEKKSEANNDKPQSEAVSKGSPKRKGSEAGDDSDSDLDSSHESESQQEETSTKPQNGQVYNEEDDEDWEKLQSKISRREKVLETKSKKSHTVHCPYFPEDKQEYWWVYIIDKKHKSLVTTPYHLTDFVDFIEVPLKFPAPPKADRYSYSIHLRSDSYMDCDRMQSLVLDVKTERKEEVSHPQWDISEEEKEEQEASGESDFTTDDDVTDSDEHE